MTRQVQLVRQIRSRLALLDRTQGDLGAALGLGHAAMSARMNGRREFTFTELEKIADYFGLTLRDLFSFEVGEGER